MDPASSLADPGESLVAAQTDMGHSLDSLAIPPVEDTALSPSACLLFLQILEELRTAAQKERDSSGGLATKPHTDSKASPPPLAPRIPEKRDSLPLTPPYRDIAGLERGRSEESLGWNVIRNTPPDNIASGN